MISSIIGSIVFSMVLILYILLALGFPYGEFAMGGKHKILPPKNRLACLISIIIQAFAIIVLLNCGRVISIGFTDKTVQVLCYFFAGYLSLNVLMNLLSKSKKERIIPIHPKVVIMPPY